PFDLVKRFDFWRKEIATGKDFRLHAQRHPDIRRHADRLAVKFRRRDADDRVGGLANADLAAKSRSIFSQPVPPEAVADNGDRVRVAHFIDFWAEGSAQNGTHAQHRKIRAAYQADVGRRALAARFVAFGCNTYLEILAGRGEHTRENLVILRELLELRIGNQVAVAIGESLLEALRVGVGEKDQLLRILDRQIFQQHSI